MVLIDFDYSFVELCFGMCRFRFGNRFSNGSCDVTHMTKRVYTVEINKYIRMMSNVPIFDNVQRQLLAKYYRKIHLLEDINLTRMGKA